MVSKLIRLPLVKVIRTGAVDKSGVMLINLPGSSGCNFLRH